MHKIVGFPMDFICERGGTVAIYDYAVANEDCGNKSIIFYQSNSNWNKPMIVEKFKKRF